MRGLVRRDARDEERGRRVLVAEDIENARREARIRPVVEGEGDFPRRPTLLLDAVGMRIAREALLDDRPGCWIVADAAPAALRGAGDLPDVAVAGQLRAVGRSTDRRCRAADARSTALV
jgi:hypothetical protein